MGIVYVLANDAMEGYIKIGKTKNLEKRMKSLDQTPVPLPFSCLYAAELDDSDRIEKLLHETFADKRVRKSREFFEVSPDQIISAIKIAPHKDVTPKNDIINDIEDQEALDKVRKRSQLNFKMIEIPPNEELYFIRDNEIKCRVLSDNKNIEFEGKIMSLSASAAKILQEKYDWNSSRIQGALYWCYKKETLVERRLRMERE